MSLLRIVPVLSLQSPSRMKADLERCRSVKLTVRRILSCQYFSSIFADGSKAGLTYCAICALSFLGRMPEANAQEAPSQARQDIAYEECVHCIISRQSTNLEEMDEEGHQLDAASPPSEPPLGPSAAIGYLPHLGPLSLEEEEPRDPSPPPLSTSDEDLRYVGFNGRPNKVVDTCYSFWNLGALAVRTTHSCILTKR
jgi:geranylgeranyl transferase type-1 subunit beta